jgi:hypothetical protein
MSKPFDIYDYVHNNKISLKVEANRKATNVTKGYNDIRKTNLNEVKIVNGKFSIKESLNGDKRPLSNEVKKHFLEIISTYNTFQEQMQRASDLTEVANTLGGIVEAAKELTLRETADWFDGVTVKRNMSELDKMDKSFQKFAVEARAMDERLHSLYEDMGHILSRYYEIADIQPDVMRERLGLRKSIKEAKKYDIGSDLNENLTKQLLAKYQDKTGPEGLIISKLLVLERVLIRIKKYQSEINSTAVIDLVLKTFKDIRGI